MIKKLLQSIIIGLAAAMLIVLVLSGTSQNNILAQFFKPQVASYSEAVRIAAPAVVNVYTRSLQESNSNNFDVNNLGSGVIMRSDGYIVTNKHVIQNADQIIVALQNGNIYQANIIGSDWVTDLAVLKINANNLPTIPQNPARVVNVGDVALAIGNPYNLGQSVSQGIISATGRNTISEFKQQNFIQTDASINQGNSGGALINSLGELIGINTLSIGRADNEVVAEGLGFAIPIKLANEVMNKIIKDGRVIRGFFGIESRIFASGPIEDNSQKGVLVTNLSQNGPAARAGIQIGDVIVKFGDVVVASPSQMVNMVAEMKPSTIVTVQVLRRNKLYNFPVEIGEYPIN
ncbi:outer membrane-stress sensor serine endopeptidase DegS [Gallibacterium sp. AGMB14963]|uniref:outer membrane-stress sensor serine endopeptidase DegS n=1 Tax=Gallibacterium faecale TaxID=3019086 RepID=UPI0022F1ABC4|nr:outer membrane-stress sensor serine endopeptidase DegS [Gallibacterium sp. AGMB14963]MDA3978326.1 outer membrane-stress sensor serine endopeptidase DegS [Gallibacterium sp. AGMB14963]